MADNNTERYRAMGNNRAAMDRAMTAGDQAEQERLQREYDQLAAQQGGKQ